MKRIMHSGRCAALAALAGLTPLLALALVLTLAAGSCAKLDQEPISYPTPDKIFRDTSPAAVLEGLEGLANGLYRKLYAGNSTNGTHEFNCRLFAMCVGADDVIRGAVKDGFNNRVERMDELDVYPYSGVVADDGKSDVAFMWRNMYSAIEASSSLIAKVLPYKIRGTAFDLFYDRDTAAMVAAFCLADYEEMVAGNLLQPGDTALLLAGEAYFVRALAYFYLVRFFGDVPCYADHTYGRGVNGEAAVGKQVPRTPVRDVYAKMIVRDLLLAAELLPPTSRSGTSATPSRWAAKACLADVYMHMAGWPLRQTGYYAQAAARCEDIMANSGLQLAAAYEDLWKEALKEQSREHIFALHHRVAASPTTASYYGRAYYSTDEGGWGDYLLDSAFYEAFHADKRKTFVAVTTLETPKGRIHWKQSSEKAPPINKYRDYGGGLTSQQANGLTPIYRYAQVLLMYAEASNLAYGPNPLAEQCVRMVQQRSTLDGQPYLPAGLSREELDRAIFDELGWELAVEAKRWFQLVRRERVVAQNQLNRRVKAKLDARGCTAEAAAQAGKGYLFPIPTDDIGVAAASGVTLTQNPGY